MNSNGNIKPSTRGEKSAARAGAFAKRRNPLPDDSPENDNVTVVTTVSAPLHVQQQNTIDLAESSIDHHQRLEWDASLRSYRNTKLLFSNLVDVVPKGRLTLINLSRRGIGKEEAKLIKEAILCNPQLFVLKLPYNTLRDEGASIIASAISVEVGVSHHNLSVLDLGFNCIGDTGCGYLALHCIAGNKHLHSLCLAGNQIGPDGAAAVATGIIHGTTLRNVNLSANKIGPDGVKALAGAIAKSEAQIKQMVADGDLDVNIVRPMEHLHLGSTAMASDGFSAISVMVLLNSSLQSLSLCDNHLDDQDMLLLSQALTQNNRKIPLELLHLSFNYITCHGVECLMNAVWGSSTLREIKLDNNRIKDRGVQLCAVVLTSIDLQTIDLSFNKATNIGIKALMKTLTDNTSLKCLAISGIPIDQTASKAVSYALAYNNTLNALYLDSCSTGYASQRHIVAGAVSNSRSSLRILTGFGISQIAMTLGMPWLPETWTNDQVLGFFSYMWQKWLQKSSSNSEENPQRGPAPPAAVAAASKIAFSSLGPNAANMFRTEDHNKPLKEGAPVEPAESSFLERTDSGTLSAPSSIDSIKMEISEIDLWASKSSRSDDTVSSLNHATKNLLNDPERRNLNVRWLRHHFRSLSDIGRLPFHNADLWHLHQYFFSPPFQRSDEPESATSDLPSNVASALPSYSNKDTFQPEHLALLTTFADALTGHPDTSHGTKRTTPVDSDHREKGPVAKKAKNVMPRIEYYPRVMARLQALGTKPIEQTLSLLRQLKYTESAFLAGRNLYVDDFDPNVYPSYVDVEMILLDIL